MKNRTLLLGEGLFETWRVYPGRKLPFVKEHLNRMKRGACYFNWPFCEKMAIQKLNDVLKEIPPDIDARLRLTLVCYGEDRITTEFLTHWEPLSPELDRFQREGVAVTIAPFKKHSSSPLRYFKTTCFLENSHILKKARQRGFYEAIFLNERDEITEGCISNIFFVKNEHVILTPSLKSGLLPGITRQKMIKLLKEMDLCVKETNLSLHDLTHFQGAFLTNAVVEVLPVTKIDTVPYSSWAGCKKLLAAYRELVNKENCLLVKI